MIATETPKHAAVKMVDGIEVEVGMDSKGMDVTVEEDEMQRIGVDAVAVEAVGIAVVAASNAVAEAVVGVVAEMRANKDSGIIWADSFL